LEDFFAGELGADSFREPTSLAKSGAESFSNRGQCQNDWAFGFHWFRWTTTLPAEQENYRPVTPARSRFRQWA
jgi:hypothetical protein